MDAPSTLVWEHASGVRAVLDITFAPDTYFRSEFYGGDERVEITGTKGYARCNRISACGIQEPAVVVYRDGEARALHALDDRPPDAFDATASAGIDYLQHGGEPPMLPAVEARRVLAALTAALESSRVGHPVDVPP
jgi:predicted dehydrogenase